MRLRLLANIALLFVATGCCNAGSDSSQNALPAESAAAPLPSAAAPSAPSAAETPAPAPTAERQIAGAAHILVAWKGAERAPKTVTRSKEEAKKRAQEVHKLVKDGKQTFEELVAKYTDDEISKAANGAIGNFERNAMPPAFADATFAMEVGTISDVVETAQGFHIIKRTR
ncbi:peptidylprolyl isomerase [Polyangium jinanense]|uniref:peptidylprolyl isomerase n=1 Tax=Polyangium jinanense TaxID=2829994 RepID=A0A9X3XA03_9BACT|nr:peptidylprolyl isomerase [Polyangium jinanense]MDC3958714.1 peptidyl-prolyl cis-trans isomerase [Polyangium jinanense]MDC3985305.1 peptidyl-prolyl cis-trans isomerase [Polyangium jinanense]